MAPVERIEHLSVPPGGVVQQGAGDISIVDFWQKRGRPESVWRRDGGRRQPRFREKKLLTGIATVCTKGQNVQTCISG